MKVLVTGVKGQLGYDVMNELASRGIEGIGVDVEEMDITDKKACETVISDVKPDAVIHCAAYTAVDAAEKRYPIIGQRATGAFCTNGYETQCPTYGNNAWNNAQALLFAGEFNINVLDYTSGYTKYGNNILNDVFILQN